MLSAGLVGLYRTGVVLSREAADTLRAPAPRFFSAWPRLASLVSSPVTQLRVWEALETLFLAHLTTMVALIGVAELCFRHAATPGAFIEGPAEWLPPPQRASRPRFISVILLEAATATSTVIAQVCVAMLWLRRRVWSQYPKMLMLGAQALVIISAGIELLERAHDCDWELEMDYNDNPLRLQAAQSPSRDVRVGHGARILSCRRFYALFALCAQDTVALRMEYWLIPRADLSNGKASKAQPAKIGPERGHGEACGPLGP